jgi:hypothetical protein
MMIPDGALAGRRLVRGGQPRRRRATAICAKERFYLDKADRNLLHGEITVHDHALTRPWTVIRDLRRNPNSRPKWEEFICAENNSYVTIGKEIYFLSADGLLMPMRKGQPAPDLR